MATKSPTSPHLIVDLLFHPVHTDFNPVELIAQHLFHSAHGVVETALAHEFVARPGLDLVHLPMVIDFDETWYFKPEVGQFLASPADETPSPPCDAQPEEMDIAVAVERIETATTLQIRRIKNKWAGLRSFVADKNLVVGYDQAVEGLFWLAGQGGYGIQTGESAGRLAASLALGRGMPGDIGGLGVSEAALSPARFTQG